MKGGRKPVKKIMKKYKLKSTDIETEPDYPVTLTCIDCGDKEQLSGEYCEFHNIDNSNYKCSECDGYDPSNDLPGGHPCI